MAHRDSDIDTGAYIIICTAIDIHEQKIMLIFHEGKAS